MLSHLLLAAVCCLRPLGGATERSPVITEVAGRVHLVLYEIRQRGHWANTNIWAWTMFALSLHVIWTENYTTKNIKLQQKIFKPLEHSTCTSVSLMCAGCLTSRISNLSVLTLLQVFFSLETGLMFIPAERQRQYMSIQNIYRDKPKKLSRLVSFKPSIIRFCSPLNWLA